MKFLKQVHESTRNQIQQTMRPEDFPQIVEIEEKLSIAPNFLLEPKEQLPKDSILISDKRIMENESEVKKSYL